MKKGPLFEKAVVEFLQGEGWTHAERRVMGGRFDKGDVAGIPNVCLEVKNTGVMELGRAVAECEKEQANAGTRYGVVVFKRRGKSTDKAYAVLPLDQLSRLLRIADAEGWLA